MSNDLPQSSPVNVERHIQSALTALLVALVGWLTFTVQASSVEIARLTERLTALEQTMRVAAADKFSGLDAGRELALRDQRIDELNRRVERLERAE